MVNRSTEKNKLTETQAKVLNFIKERCRQNGVPPSYREIQAHFGYNAIGTVQDHVRALIKKGMIEKPENNRQARGMLPKGHKLQQAKRIVVYGEVAAGPTRQAEQLELDHVVVADSLSKKPDFALRVVGNSMIDIGIYEGDMLIVEKDVRIKNNDIVVALLDGETTVKRYQKLGGEITLIAENKYMKPISVKGRTLQIQGKVVGLQRKL